MSISFNLSSTSIALAIRTPYAGPMNKLSRRTLAKAAPFALFVRGNLRAASPEAGALPEGWPVQEQALAREMVTVAHGNLKRTQELVKAHPSLVNATIDWGFGDWESALGGASHVGSRAVAEFLIANGARPTLFSAAMLGHLEVVRSMIEAQPGSQRLSGPHSISLLAHARAGGTPAQPVLRYLENLGDAGSQPALPLSPAQLKIIAGTWKFGPGPADIVEISVNNNSVQFARKGTTARNLNHLGDLEFFPAGAAAVRIGFVLDKGEMLLKVDDDGTVLSARKQ